MVSSDVTLSIALDVALNIALDVALDIVLAVLSGGAKSLLEALVSGYELYIQQ